VNPAGRAAKGGGRLPWPLIATLAAFASVPLWARHLGLYDYLALEVLIWSLFATAYNLTLGYTGLPSFGHAAFFGIGGYAFGLFQFHVYPSLWGSLAASLLAAAAAGALVASLISHRRGIYYALLTVAFGEAFVFICTKWYAVTRGEDGLLNIRRLPVALGPVSLPIQTNVALLYFVLVLFGAVVWALWRLVHSPFGHAMQAIRQNDLRAGFLGYNVWLCKWLVFVISAMLAGLAGGLFAMAQEGAYVQVMTLQWSGIVVLMTLTGGGLVSFWGPMLGTVVFFVARDVLGALTETWLIWYGLMFMAIVMFKPEGIAGMLQGLPARARRARASPLAPAGGPADGDDGLV
jgi:branched-chain amino acid transport system permease protein